MLFDLDNDRNEQENLVSDRKYAEVYRRLGAALDRELMISMSVSMHDRMPSPTSMSGDEDMARKSWQWRYPTSIDGIQGQDFDQPGMIL